MTELLIPLILAVVGTPVAILAAIAIFDKLSERALSASDRPKVPNAPPEEPEAAQGAEEPSRCGSCAHFDLAIGQRTLAGSGAFAAAAAHIPPWQMGADFDDAGELVEEPSRATLKLEWSDFGACMVPLDDANDRSRSLVADSDICPKYEKLAK